MYASKEKIVNQKAFLLRFAKGVCLIVVIVSVLSCVGIAVVRSEGLVRVHVVWLGEDSEPVDHNIPLFKRKDALPDYQVIVNQTDGRKVDLGTRPNTSAAAGLEWTFSDPISRTEISSIRLQEQDVLISDVVAEVQVTSDSVVSNNYRFNFEFERSFAVGLRSFFQTPIGLAIAGGFFVAILLLIVAQVA